MQDESAAYGQNMPQFLKALRDNQRRFSSPPVGPLGMMIKVRDEYKRYAEVIECQIGERNTKMNALGASGEIPIRSDISLASTVAYNDRF